MSVRQFLTHGISVEPQRFAALAKAGAPCTIEVSRVTSDTTQARAPRMATQVSNSIGVPGQPWGAHEKEQWLRVQTRKRSYAAQVSARIERLASRFDVEQYGELPYVGARHPLWAV